jgi:protein involved in polysaccharide export with SLBB domain
MNALHLALVGILLAVLGSTVNAQTLTALKPGDPIVIDLKVPAEDAPNVSTKMNVSKQGTIRVAYLDREIPVAGLNTTEVARRIEQAYKAAEIYTSPTIVVTSTTPNDYVPHIVTVGGEVKSGGREVALRDGMTLYQAIMAAGGFTEFADTKRVKLIRSGGETIVDMKKTGARGAASMLLKDGDVIHVPQD